MVKKLFFPVIFLFLSHISSASHLMGGEITWECLSSGPNSGKFVFTMILYRDCNGSPLSAGTEILSSNSPVTSINLNFVSQIDESPVCNPNDTISHHITCAGASSAPGYDTGATEEFTYRSAPVTIAGIPPVSGWTFWWSSCCRPAAVKNMPNPGSLGYTLRAKMYSYNGQNTNPCFDNSPKFLEKAKTMICSGYKFTFNHNAGDIDLDSLSYDWAEPLDYTSPPTGPPIAFSSGYTYTNPLPDTSENPNNIGAQINPINGEISFKSYTSGPHALCSKVTAWRCGFKVAEIFRDILITLKTCQPLVPGPTPYFNIPPTVQAPYYDASGNPRYIDTVYAGQLVTFQIIATDFDLDAFSVPQQISSSVSGSQVSSTYTGTTDCLRPPCATITPNPTTSVILQQTLTLNWQTTCDHIRAAILCRIFSNIYNFAFRTFDDFCPVPGLNVTTVTIVVLPPPLANPPKLKCASVNNDGSVDVSWMPGNDTLLVHNFDTIVYFKGYDLYRANSFAGPYTFLDSITDKSITTYHDSFADAYSNTVFYHMKVRSGCDNYDPGLNYSDTIQAIYLDVTNSGTGFANLQWNSTKNPLIPTNHQKYRIYREYPPTVWVKLDSVDAAAGMMSYNDPITICHDTVRYRIDVADSSGCVSRSNVDGDFFSDILPPVQPIMDSVSVQGGTDNVQVSWFPDSSLDTWAYIVLQLQGSSWVRIDTVYGRNNTSYSSSVIQGHVNSQSIRVLAVDSCWNPSPMSVEHNTIFLDPHLDPCNALIRLQWNSYINWPGGVRYDVYRSENGQPPLLLSSTNNTNYVDSPLVQFSTYCYYVQGVDESSVSPLRTSSSNDTCIFADIPRKPEFCYIISASVMDVNQVRLKVYTDIQADVQEYHVMRSENYGGPYMQVGTIDYSTDSIRLFTDYTALTDLKSYYYKVVVIDTCWIEAKTSDIGHTIHLSVDRTDDVSNIINWNEYEIWLGNVGVYQLYRSVDGVPEATPAATIAPGNTKYIDPVIKYVYSSVGEFCYRVEAYEDNGNPYGFRDTSYSNEACIAQKPLVFVPNAFNPMSVSDPNQEFNPSKYFVDALTYHMRIYNRFGELIFSSSDIHKGWDGTYKGNAVPGGVYVYMFELKATDGTEIEKNGTVTLIR